ncbi:MAG: RNA polymerase sigma factor [Planctomycetes bacterium]|nr:RNA polymerase sigma factor [Planctomycetota bacterium]
MTTIPASPASASTSAILARLSARRDEEAWGQLIALHGRDLFSAAYRVTGNVQLAEDATQEALLAVRSYAHTFLPRGDDHELAARAWLMRIACTCAINLVRGETRRHRRERTAAQGATTVSSPSDRLASIDLAARVRTELEHLPDRHRLPLAMHYFGGLDHAHVASALNISPGNARVRLHRALQALRERLSHAGIACSAAAIGDALTVPAVPPPAPGSTERWRELLASPRSPSLESPVNRSGVSMLKFAIAACLIFAGATATSFMVGAEPAAAVAPTPKPLASEPAAAPLPSQTTNIGVFSDKVEDVSSMEAWKKSFITDGMTDEQKGLAIWKSAVMFRHQEPPPVEYLGGDNDEVHDAIKTFNVYGYGMCCCVSSNIESLARYVGLEARGYGIHGHSVPEVKWNGAWHLLDASLICYFPKADGSIASVDELVAGIGAWYGEHPEFLADPDKLLPFGRGGNWKKSGPEILSRGTNYNDNGWLPAATHGWYSTMQEYCGKGGGSDGKYFTFDYGYSQGYQVNIQLRPGERLTRNWSNRGLHVNQDLGGGPGCMTEKTGQGQLVYAPAYGDLTNNRVGNGTLAYDVPLASGAFRGSALAADNLACTADDKAAPAVHVKDAAKPAVLEIRLPSSYVYLGGAVSFDAKRGKDGTITLAYSDNNGLDWKEIAKPTDGATSIDLKSHIYRRYDYRLRFTMTGSGTGLDSLAFTHDIQHSQRALPALAAGSNTIRFSTGPQESTLTIEAATNPANAGKQLVVSDFHPVLENIADGRLLLSGGQGSITFPVTTPGDITRLRFGCNFRARDARDGWDLQVSFDSGKTFVTADRAEGPTGYGNGKYITFSKVPPRTREALVRYSGQQFNTTMIQRLRIDADYLAPNAGFRPVKVTYTWKEQGQPKQDVHIAKSADETYTITCAEKPEMGAIVLELADR